MKLLLIFLVALFSDANQLYSDGNYAEAAKAYEEIITEQPNSEVYYNLGNAYFKQNELAKAILAYERCLRLDPRKVVLLIMSKTIKPSLLSHGCKPFVICCANRLGLHSVLSCSLLCLSVRCSLR